MNVVTLHRSLDDVDFRILKTLEDAHKKYEFVPHEFLERRVDEGRLRKLHHLGLLRRNATPWLGWKLTPRGYDVLAFHALRRRIAKLASSPIGVGKDSVVYMGETHSGLKVVLKFHKSSKHTRVRHMDYIFGARSSALAEFSALTKIFEAGGLVPEPIMLSKHVVVMRYIEGVELYKCKRDVLDDVLHTVKTALSLGIVHGDLSPYNVLVGDRGYVIDWSQWVPLDKPGALERLKRDVDNIAEFFNVDSVTIYRELGMEYRQINK